MINKKGLKEYKYCLCNFRCYKLKISSKKEYKMRITITVNNNPNNEQR